MVTLAPAPASLRRSWFALAALVPAVMAVGLDTTILAVALPTLAGDLGASTDQLQWFVIGYTLVFAAAMIPAGLVGDRWGRRRVLIASLVVFVLGSVACALSRTPDQLIAARMVLGLGGAGIVPTALGLLTVLFDETVRPRATATLMSATMLGYPVGPILGGWILQHHAWGWVFAINIPLALLALAVVATLVPESRASVPPRIDVAGVVLSSAALALVCYGVSRAGDTSWGATSAWLPTVAGIATAVTFWVVEGRVREPLVPPALFARPGFVWGVAVASALSFVLFGLLFVVPQYSSAILGADAQGAGVRLLPFIVGMLLGSAVAPRAAARLGRDPVIVVGLLLLAGAMAIAGRTTTESGDARLVVWVGLAGLGLGLALPPAADQALGDLDPEASGVGSGVMQAVRMVAGTLGAALLGSAFNSTYRGALPPLDALPGDLAVIVGQGAQQGLAVAEKLGSADLATAVREAFVTGMGRLGWICAAVSLATAVIVLVGACAAARRRRRETMAE